VQARIQMGPPPVVSRFETFAHAQARVCCDTAGFFFFLHDVVLK